MERLVQPEVCTTGAKAEYEVSPFSTEEQHLFPRHVVDREHRRQAYHLPSTDKLDVKEELALEGAL